MRNQKETQGILSEAGKWVELTEGHQEQAAPNPLQLEKKLQVSGYRGFSEDTEFLQRRLRSRAGASFPLLRKIPLLG